MKGTLPQRFPRGRSAGGLAATQEALRPNQALEEARFLATIAQPDNLVRQDDYLLLTSENKVLLIEDPSDAVIEPEEILRFDTAISALAASPDGGLAVGLSGAGIALVGGAHDGVSIADAGGQALSCVTALRFAGPDTLFLCQGSSSHPPDGWQRDLLEGRAGGSVWRYDLSRAEAVCLGEGLAYPNGLLPLDGGDRLVVSEGWQRRLLELGPDRRPRVLLDDLPGYPGRLADASGTGAWLAVFAPHPHDPVEPLPTYGLVLRLDGDFLPAASLHSAVDAGRHGVTSCLEARGEVLIACRGDNALVAVELLDE